MKRERKHSYYKEESQLSPPKFLNNKRILEDKVFTPSNYVKKSVLNNISEPKTVVLKGNWTPEEDKILIDLINLSKEYFNWSLISTYLPRRTSKQCRERWLLQLDPNINKSSYTDEENYLIFLLQKKHKNKWSLICKNLDNRTDNSIKNQWNTKIKRKLSFFNKKYKKDIENINNSILNNKMAQLDFLIDQCLCSIKESKKEKEDKICTPETPKSPLVSISSDQKSTKEKTKKNTNKVSKYILII